jgi:hypothetical protein
LLEARGEAVVWSNQKYHGWRAGAVRVEKRVAF